jgi:hypothetical protein
MSNELTFMFFCLKKMHQRCLRGQMRQKLLESIESGEKYEEPASHRNREF